ncbi:zinc-finger associated domain containing protein, partial [Oryctes borbonicus]
RNKVIHMSTQIGFEGRTRVNALSMDTMFDLADCCRTCLRLECSLTPTNSSDSDSIKFCDKLAACISGIMWAKEGLPSFICAMCIEKLRIAYDFRTVCLQSDQALQRYTNHLQGEAKDQSSNRSLTTPTKFEYTISTVTQDGLPCIIEEPQKYLHLEHFLDNEELLKSEQLGETTQSSRSSTPERNNSGGFITSEDGGQTVNRIKGTLDTPQIQEEMVFALIPELNFK